MSANCRVDFFVLFGKLNCALQRTTVWIASADIHNCGDTRVPSALNNFLAVRIKLRTVYVCMGIDKHLFTQS
jgi:hypothetical protein